MTDQTQSKPSCKQVVDILPDPFVIIDRNYRILATNTAYRRHYGVKDEDVVGRLCHAVSHHSPVPCSHNGEHCPMQEIFEKKRTTNVIHVHYDKRGREERVQLQAVPIFGDDGEVLYMGEYIQPICGAGCGDTLLVGRSQPLLRMISLLQRVAPTQTTVLLLGESGVGKEKVAEYLHHYSNRVDGPFVVVDCGTLGENLIETELFGYEKGAFTGADRRKPGLFEAANRGTLFIDEVGELPMPLQSKLLRALETGTIRRVGGTEYLRIDTRVVAATNRDLQAMVAKGQFRSDLYYRLSAFPVEVPTLRDRKDDIPALAAHFLSGLEDGDRHIPLDAAVIEELLGYDYPGNVRELRNVIERAAILAGDGVIRPENITFASQPSAAGETGQPDVGVRAALASHRRRRVSDQQILGALESCGGHRAEAARRLGISERTLYRHVERLRSTG